MTGLFDEGLIEPISNGKAADRELVDEHSMNGAFVIRAGVAAHQELSSGYDDHFGFDDHCRGWEPGATPGINAG